LGGGTLLAEVAPPGDLGGAGDSVVEQPLDLGAVAGAAVGVFAAARVHQERHRALQLCVALRPLVVRHARPRLVDLPHVGLRNEPLKK